MIKNKKFRNLSCLFLCILILFGCTKRPAEPPLENPGVRVTYFDVGKGDAVLIETQKHTMLIDAGYDHTYSVIHDYLAQQDIETLDYLVLTHFDKDHVGGADHVIEDFKVGEVLQPDYASDADEYLEYCAATENRELNPVLVTETMQFAVDEAEFFVYPPQKEDYKEEDNDFSLVISMAYKEKSFLFTGDCEKERLDELLAQTEFDLSHDMLKVPHHGKKENNSEEFLNAVAPEAAVITCSEEQPASSKICKMLKDLDTQIYLTSDGTVTCLCDGSTLKIVQKP